MIQYRQFKAISHNVIISVSLASALSLAGCSALGWGGKKGAADDGTLISDQDLALAEKQRFGDGNIPRAQDGGPLEDIHFGYDSYEIPTEYQETLSKNASFLKSNPSIRAEVEGHADDRGTNEYNLALGEKRAKAVTSMLVNLGVKPSQLSTISYGEEIPLVPGESDEARAANRRAHFALSEQG